MIYSQKGSIILRTTLVGSSFFSSVPFPVEESERRTALQQQRSSPLRGRIKGGYRGLIGFRHHVFAFRFTTPRKVMFIGGTKRTLFLIIAQEKWPPPGAPGKASERAGRGRGVGLESNGV